MSVIDGLPARALEVTGHLVVEDPAGQPIQVHLDGATIRVVLPRAWLGRQAMAWMPARAERIQWLMTLRESLARTDLRLEFCVGRWRVARLQGTSRGGVMTRWLGMQPLELRPGVMLAWVWPGREAGRPASQGR